MTDSHHDDRLDREGWIALTRLSRDVVSLAADVGRVTEVAERCDRTIRGYNGRVGIDTRVDRLEQAAKGGTRVQEAKWRAWAEIGIAAGVVASLVLHVLKLTGVMP
jgi:hypothetical protein